MMKIIIISVLIGVSLGSDVQYDVYKERMDCPGNEIEHGVDKTIQECLQRCDALHDCAAVTTFRINKNSHDCSFKKKCAPYDMQRLPEACYCRLYVKRTRTYEVQHDKNCLGIEIKKIVASNVAECITSCNDAKECVAFFRNSTECSLKKECNEKEESNVGSLYLNNLGQFQYLPGVTCKNKDASTKINSPGQCIRKCVETKGCVAAVYDHEETNNKCMLTKDCREFSREPEHDIYLSPDSGILAAPTSVKEGSCKTMGGQCRLIGKCDAAAGERRCSDLMCDLGKECCCRVEDEDQCTAEGGSCKKKCKKKNNEDKCGPCGKGTERFCCCKND